MSRRKAAPKRPTLPDPLFGNEVISRFINVVMRAGKKSVAEKIVYGALEKVVERTYRKKTEQDSEGGGDEGSAGSGGVGSIFESAAARKFALEQFEKALDNVRPAVEVKSRRVGGSNYQVPVEIRASRRSTLGMRWLVEYSAKRGEKTMVLRMASEICDALLNRGNAVKKRDETHRMAKANQAFAHYRW